MPHSSGGGSHSSGGHSGSSHSSSGGSSSSSGSSANRISSRPFTGAVRYVYYRNGRPSYLYSNYDVSKKDPLSKAIQILLYIPFVVLAFVILFVSFTIPFNLHCDDTEIIISDVAGVINDEDSLRSSLEEFMDRTGITPAVMTVYNEDWINDYNSLENYAYDLYVNSFDDEDHWLIVYSEPKNSPGFTDWYWEGMQGDNTDTILNDKVLDVFNSSMQKYLTDSGYSAGSAISLSFQQTTPKTMKIVVDTDGLLFSLIFSGFIFFAFGQAIVTDVKGRKYSDAKPCPVVIREEKCDYCGGIYVVGTCTSCPHCGAPVKPHEYTEEEKKEATAYVNMISKNK